MRINADFSQRAELCAEQHQWVHSPQSGVHRVMLDRIGAKKARATSLVRYAPDSYFPHHLHPGGEEILVLQGVFSADDKHYPAGWYLRNPPGSGHQPYSDEGATIFVKLRQMTEDEKQYVAIDTNDAEHWQAQGKRQVCPLFSSEYEQVSLQRLQSGETVFDSRPEGGAELLVVSGSLVEMKSDQLSDEYSAGSWMRLPAVIDDNTDEDINSELNTRFANFKAGSDGVTLYLKTGHLAQVIGADNHSDS